MTVTVFIDGAAGTTGLEIAGRLESRPEFELVRLDADQRKDATARREALNEADIAILCLPDDAAREAVALVDPNSGTRVIDASSAHRVADGWIYGFPELIGAAAIASAERVSNPGCYPTGFLALIAPLTKASLLPTDWPYAVHAVSGYSGGGNALIERFESDPDIAYRAYALSFDHKHLAEMQKHAGLIMPPLFLPAVVHAFRGMVVDVPLPRSLLRNGATPDKLRKTLLRAYDGCELVRVHHGADQPSELLLRNDAPEWDGIELWVFANHDETQARLVARLDNLGKGASGAAVQNLNLMAGLPQMTGLHLNPVAS